MWFGGNGLIKYDGYNFKIFKYNPDDKKSLSYNGVISIYEDRSGTLWIGTEGGGLNKYNRETDQFTRYAHDANNPNSLSNNVVASILEDRSGNFWVGTFGGLNKLISDDSVTSFIHYKNDLNEPTSLSNDFVGQICEDKSGNLWIATGDGLNKLSPGEINKTSPTFIHYKHILGDPKSLSHNAVFSVYADNSGVLWVGTIGGGINKLIPGDSNESTPSFIHYLNNPEDQTSLSNNMIWSIFEDAAGNFWFGTLGGGLNKFNRVNEKFTNYKSDPNDSKSLNGNSVYSIYEDDSGIL